MSIKYTGPNDDELKLWKVTFSDRSVKYVDAYGAGEAAMAANTDTSNPIVKVEFDLCLHDNDWWDEQTEGADCPFAYWS